MSRNPNITSVQPTAGIPGGEISVWLEAVTVEMVAQLEVRFHGVDAHLVSVSTSRALALVPEVDIDGLVQVTVATDPAQQPEDSKVTFTMGKRLAGNLHPVTNPAFDPNDGSLFVTRSGSRGEH